ncbi:MAG TPA: amidohydrolase family protein [Acidimicrobiales bacterium]|nr:amidohydrolase family protein [Acidimicrobiales bacterium]
MQVDDMILISIDDHVVEPKDMFERHVPARYAADAPRIVEGDDGMERWVFQGVTAGSMGLNAVVSWPKEEWGMDPTTFAEMRPGAYDVHARVRDMDRNGVLASMCFPSFAGFSANTFHRAADKDLALVMLQAYNDWHVDEWCAAHPGRFIPLAIPPVWDMDALVAEVHRTAAKGVVAMSMPELPHLQDLPSYHSDFWDPFFTAVSDEGMAMCLHIGQGFGAISSPPEAPIDNLIVLATQVSALAAQDLLWGPAFHKFPELKVVWSEAGIGWIPFYLDRCDRHYTNQRWLRHDFGDDLPSDIFRRHCLACYVTDPSALKLRREIGVDIIAWECDYPHSDSLWPDAPEVVLAELTAAGATDEEINKITWENSARFIGFDPFAHRPRTEATVAALRAGATDVETATVSREEWRRRYEAQLSA